jgi:hypothetical protein
MISYLPNKIYFSKLREVFVDESVLEKNLSQFSKIPLQLLGIRAKR